jgi:hypothetical protein
MDAGAAELPEGAMIAVLAGIRSRKARMSSASKCQRTISFRHIMIRRPKTSRLSPAAFTRAWATSSQGQGPELRARWLRLDAGRYDHYAWATAEVHGDGPFAIVYVNPADDPSKTNCWCSWRTGVVPTPKRKTTHRQRRPTVSIAGPCACSMIVSDVVVRVGALPKSPVVRLKRSIRR